MGQVQYKIIHWIKETNVLLILKKAQYEFNSIWSLDNFIGNGLFGQCYWEDSFVAQQTLQAKLLLGSYLTFRTVQDRPLEVQVHRNSENWSKAGASVDPCLNYLPLCRHCQKGYVCNNVWWSEFEKQQAG